MAASEGIAAVVLGATGAVGKEVLREIIKSPKFSKVIVITRRNIENINDAKVVQHVVDFDNLYQHKDAFLGAKVAYCCLGTTRGKSGADGFVRVDRDYVFEAAKLCKEVECPHFHLVTARGSNSNSSMLYMKTKGEVETMITDLQFPRCSIYRPALLLCEREDSRPLERVAQILAKGFDWRSKFSIATETVAHAMITNTFLASDSNVEVLENQDIHKLGID